MKKAPPGGIERWVGETPGTEVPGSRIISELPPNLALSAWVTFRLVMLYAIQRIGDEPAGTPFNGDALPELVQDLCGRSSIVKDGIATTLATILVDLTSPAPDLETLARRCLCVTEWALSGARPGQYTGTALAFAEAAAWVSSSARYWFLAGKLHRHHGAHVKAEFFLMRGMELARSQGDRETVVRLRLSHGNTLLSRGDYQGAKQEYERALRWCLAYGLRGSVKAEVHHDLMIVRTVLKDHARALDDAERAVMGYSGEDHPRTPFLVHDLAWLWMEMRDYQNAYAVLAKLLSTDLSFASEALSRMMVVANLLRAAAGAGAMEDYERAAVDFDALLDQTLTPAATNRHAPAALAAARGALMAGDHERFSRWIALARKIGEELGQEDVVRDAAELLKARTTEPRRRTQPPPGHARLAANALRALARD